MWSRAQKLFFVVLLCALELANCVVTPAQNESADQPVVLREAPVLSSSSQGQPFSLEFFLKAVEKNYPKLKSADAEKRISSAKRLEKAGAFDPVLTSVNEYLRVQDSFIPGKAKNAIHNESRVDLLTRSGIKLFTGARLNPNDTKTPFVPTGRGGEYYGGVAVPLLRGLRMNEKKAAEDQAKIGEPLAAHVFASTRLELLLKAAAAYWEWVGARARIDISRNLLNIAQARVGQIKRRVDKGDLPGLDIAESEQEIHRREAALVKSERDFQKYSYILSVFLWNEAGTPAPVPAEKDVPPLEPEPSKISEAEWSEGRKRAVELRPELKRIAMEREQARVDLRLAENMMLPVMDAYLAQGADTGTQGIGPVIRGGVSISAPLRQRTARGLVQSAKLKIQKLTYDETLERQRILAEVDDTVSAVNTCCERWNATLLEVKKAKQVENGERLRFNSGDSTLFLVNQRERASAEAQMRLTEVHTEYLQALAAFRTVICRL